MSSNIITDIYAFNKQAGLLGKEFDSFNELAYTLEECFEGYEGIYNGADMQGNPFKPGDPQYPTSRQLGISLSNSLKDGCDIHNIPPLTEVQEVDKSIDIVVYNIGKLAKMGLTPEHIEECFSIVSSCNMAKFDGPKDSKGKQLKPEGWTGPETRLQAILDTRKPITTLLKDS